MTADRMRDVIQIAAADIGLTENPPKSNRTKYGEWYGWNGQPWCLMAVQYWLNRAGTPLPYKCASVSELYYWYQQNAPQCLKTKPRRGDVVLYNFGHCGIVESFNGAGITAIEGNTSATGIGSQSNGGGVWRKTRSYDKIWTFISTYGEADGMSDYFTDTGGHWAREDIDLCAEKGIIKGDGDRFPTTFRPDELISRAEVAAIIARMLRGERLD